MVRLVPPIALLAPVPLLAPVSRLRPDPLRRSVIAILQGALLPRIWWITAARIVALVARQGCAWRQCSPVPAIPAGTAPLPLRAPVLSPTWRGITGPAAEEHWWAAIETHRYAQHERRHRVRLDLVPRTVVPSARVPLIIRKQPVRPIIKEEVLVELRGVVDRIPGYGHHVWIGGNIDANPHAGQRDTHANTNLRGRHGTEPTEQTQRDGGYPDGSSEAIGKHETLPWAGALNYTHTLLR